MIDLLESYFRTGFESEESRSQFYQLRIGDKGFETFPAFKARFISLATLGGVSESEWPYFLWDKLTPRLREAAIPAKTSWQGSFTKMTSHLTSIDYERRLAYESRRTRDQDKGDRDSKGKTNISSLDTEPLANRTSSGGPSDNYA